MELPLLKHDHVTVRGVRIHYVTSGEGSPLLLLHGFPQYWRMWHKLIPILSQRFKVIAPDLKGYGDSDKPRGPYDVGTLSEEWGEFMNALDVDRFDIAGHDWGGILAWKMALDYPGRIRRLVILNAPFRRWSFKPYVFFFWMPFLPELIMDRWNDAVVEEILQRASYSPEAFSAEDIKAYQEAFAGPETHRRALAYYRSLWRSYRTARADWGKKIEVPTLVLWGVADPALPVENTFGLEAHVRDLRIHYIPFAGHWIAEEQPDIVNEKIVAFLM